MLLQTVTHVCSDMYPFHGMFANAHESPHIAPTSCVRMLKTSIQLGGRIP